ncbi:histidine phosphatase family protein (plasmid) [Pseudomonas luteola]|uniref:histidine phosphatase family protein n=1 Tax=Pseudomonas luteola TaxID=47886 RepID=UPI003DA017D8
MEIILMRHGKPSLKKHSAVASYEMAQWIEEYNLSEIGADTAPPEAISLVNKIGLIATSTLPRALSSVKALGATPSIADSVFCEAELPVMRLPLIRLSPFTWAFVFRIFWLCGLSKKVESYREAKQRSIQAVDKLSSLSERTSGAVLLLGHGIMNRLIAKQLKHQGWEKEITQGKDYWSFAIFKKPE